jgi:hypothetical protein
VRGRCELVAGQQAALEDDGWRGGWVVVMGLVSGDSSTNFQTYEMPILLYFVD